MIAACYHIAILSRELDELVLMRYGQALPELLQVQANRDDAYYIPIIPGTP